MNWVPRVDFPSIPSEQEQKRGRFSFFLRGWYTHVFEHRNQPWCDFINVFQVWYHLYCCTIVCFTVVVMVIKALRQISEFFKRAEFFLLLTKE